MNLSTGGAYREAGCRLADAQDPIPEHSSLPAWHATDPQGLNGHAQTLCSAATGMCCRHLQQCSNCHTYPKKEETTNSSTVASFKTLGVPNSVQRQSGSQNQEP